MRTMGLFGVVVLASGVACANQDFPVGDGAGLGSSGSGSTGSAERPPGQAGDSGTSGTSTGDGPDDGTGSQDEDDTTDRKDPPPGDPDATTGGAEPEGSTGAPVEPRCDDGMANGSESDIDCGGTCAPCIRGDLCGAGTDCVSGNCSAGVCDIALSCAAVLEGRPSAASDTYEIHPDGGEPIDVWCDMEHAGGGWTLTYSATGPGFNVAHAIPVNEPGSIADPMGDSHARYRQYASHSEEMFMCVRNSDSAPIREFRTFMPVDRWWDAQRTNSPITLTGTQQTPNASGVEYCAGLAWGGCNLEHYGYAIFNSGSSNWGQWSSNTYYGPSGSAVYCFSDEDVSDDPTVLLQHYVR